MENSLLSQDEVNELPSGSKVVILWSGGNGPHEYTVDNKNGIAVAVECNCVIDFVGVRPLTEVSLV